MPFNVLMYMSTLPNLSTISGDSSTEKINLKEHKMYGVPYHGMFDTGKK